MKVKILFFFKMSGNWLPIDAASYLRRTVFSTTLLRKCHSSQSYKLVLCRCCTENQRLWSPLYMSLNTECVLQFIKIN